MPDHAVDDGTFVLNVSLPLAGTLLAVARGLPDAEIAGELVIGEETVKSHVSEVLRKLGCRGRVRLVIAAHEAGLVYAWWVTARLTCGVGPRPGPTRTARRASRRTPRTTWTATRSAGWGRRRTPGR